MKRIAKFHKVSWEQFRKDWVDTSGNSRKKRSGKYMKVLNCQNVPPGEVPDMIFCTGQLLHWRRERW